MSKEWKQSSKLLEPRSFDACKNAIAPIIEILDCLEIDTEVSDTGMETANSNDYREVLRDERDINSMLATMWAEARFFCKDKQKFINIFT